MSNLTYRPGRVLWALCCVAAVGAGARLGLAQDAADGFEAPPIEVDVQTIIDTAGQGGQATRFNDTVWDIRPESGRRTVLVPIRVTLADQAYELSRPSVGVRSGRFIGWYVPEASAGGGGRNANHNADTFQAGDSRDLESLLFGEADDDSDAGQGHTDDERGAANPHDPVRGDAPRLTRDLMIYPDGSVGWELDRSFTGAEMRPAGPNNLYGYKIDPRTLNDEQPERGDRLERGPNESSRDFSNRRREQQQRERDAMNAFRELRSQVQELPDTFREPLHGVVYAVYDAPDSDGWSLTGDAPLPWRIEQDDLDAIAHIARGTGGGNAGPLDTQTQEAVVKLRRLAERGGALDQRAVAMAVYQGRFAERVERGSSGFELLRTLLESEDEDARTAALVAIARVQPPTRASALLLADAARNATGDTAGTLQLASLRSAFRIEAGPDGNTGLLLSQVNDALAERGGPHPALVLEELLDAFDPDAAGDSPGRSGRGNPGGRGGLNQAPDATAIDTLITGVAFDRIDPEQMPRVAAMVIRRSPGSALAAGWLDHQLLRSLDAERVALTLDLLNQADSTSTIVRPISESVRTLVFGDAPGAAEQGEPVVINGVIALGSDQHGLLIALNSDDAHTRDLAWQALRHFTIHSPDSASSGQGQAVFDRIVDSGLDTQANPDTPTVLVDFIANQDGGPLAEHARARMIGLLLTEGLDGAVLRRAARKVASAGHDYSQTLNALDPDDRGDAVAVVYEQLTGEVPAIIGLVQASSGGMTRWLAQQWLAGVLPDESAWADAAGDYDQLLRLAGDDDLRVAIGAGSALVVRAGGTLEHQDEMAQVLSTIADRSPESIAAAWEPIRRDIFAARLSEAAGTYRLELAVFEAQPELGPGGRGNPGGLRDPGGRGGRSPSNLARPATEPGGLGGNAPERPVTQGTPIMSMDLGLVELLVEGDQVSLSLDAVPLRLAEERLALRLDNVSTLTSFNHPDLVDLPLSQLDEAVDLLPEGDGRWVGSLTLPDGRVLRVSLTREG
jgi:hypothetical protein